MAAGLRGLGAAGTLRVRASCRVQVAPQIDLTPLARTQSAPSLRHAREANRIADQGRAVCP